MYTDTLSTSLVHQLNEHRMVVIFQINGGISCYRRRPHATEPKYFVFIESWRSLQIDLWRSTANGRKRVSVHSIYNSVFDESLLAMSITKCCPDGGNRRRRRRRRRMPNKLMTSRNQLNDCRSYLCTYEWHTLKCSQTIIQFQWILQPSSCFHARQKLTEETENERNSKEKKRIKYSYCMCGEPQANFDGADQSSFAIRM